MGIFIFGIRGLAACYRKPGEKFWNIVFPTDDDHRVKLNWWKKDGEKDCEVDENDICTEYLKGKKVTVSVTGCEEREEDDFQCQSFEDVIDLTGDYLHAHGLTRRPDHQQQTNEKGEPKVGKLELTIANAKLFSCAPREHRLNFVFPFDNPAGIKLITAAEERPRIFPIIVGGIINLKADGEITINIGEGQKIINLKEGDIFFIDNDCNGKSIRNDFQHYQDLFAAPNKPEERYEMISLYDSPDPEETPIIACKFNEEPLLKEAILEPFFNNFIRTITTEPPPRICDTVRISKTEYLRKDEKKQN